MSWTGREEEKDLTVIINGAELELIIRKRDKRGQQSGDTSHGSEQSRVA